MRSASSAALAAASASSLRCTSSALGPLGSSASALSGLRPSAMRILQQGRCRKVLRGGRRCGAVPPRAAAKGTGAPLCHHRHALGRSTHLLVSSMDMATSPPAPDSPPPSRPSPRPLMAPLLCLRGVLGYAGATVPRRRRKGGSSGRTCSDRNRRGPVGRWQAAGRLIKVTENRRALPRTPELETPLGHFLQAAAA